MKKSWTTPERHAVKKIFGKYIEGYYGSSYPSDRVITEAISNCVQLQDRTSKKIRSQIQHQRNLFKKVNPS